jgi:hypothetical protein
LTGFMTTTLLREPIEWTVELLFEIEPADPSVGIMQGYCILESICAYGPLDNILRPLAVTQKEFEELELFVNENFEPDYPDYEEES